jgi:hypothetical protein
MGKWSKTLAGLLSLLAALSFAWWIHPADADQVGLQKGSTSSNSTELPIVAAAPTIIHAKLDFGKRLPYFWGAADAPPSSADLVVDSTDPNGTTITAIRLLNYAEQPLGVLWTGNGIAKPKEPFRQRVDLGLSAYGVYILDVDIVGDARPIRTSLAWLREKAPLWPKGPLGVNMHFILGPWGAHDRLGGAEPALTLAANMGASWIRDGGDGVALPGNPYWYDPARSKLGLCELNILDRYINGQPPHDPQTREEFCRRIQQTIRNKGDAVTAYEVWNEPNIWPGWLHAKPNATDYFALLKATYAAVKEVNPKATVVGMCTSGVDYSFIEQVLKMGGARYMDAISIHPYHPGGPELVSARDQAAVGTGYSGGVPFTYLARIERLKVLLDKYHAENLKIWCTEVGYTTMAATEQAVTFSEPEAARYTARLLIQTMTIPYVERTFIYNFQDRDPRGKPDNWDLDMGLIRMTGSPKPGYAAYNTLARKLFRTKFVKQYNAGPDVYCYEFAGENGPVQVAWTTRPAATITLSAGDGNATVTDLMGNERTVTPIAGRITLAITDDPRFITGSGGLSSAQPLIDVSGDLVGTTEGQFDLTFAADGAMNPIPWSVIAPIGWKSHLMGNQVSLIPPTMAPSAACPLIVQNGQMSVGVTLDLRNSVLATVTQSGAGGIDLTLVNPFPAARIVAAAPQTPEDVVEQTTISVPARSKTDQFIPVQTENAVGFITVPLTLNLSLPNGQTGTVQFSPDSSAQAIVGVTPCYPAPKRTVDGNLARWQSFKPCLLASSWNWVSVSPQPYGGPGDLSVRFWTGYDDTYFYVAAEVTDDKHVQTETGDDLWRGDSLQFALAVGEQQLKLDVAASNDGSTRIWERLPNLGVPNDIRAIAKTNGTITRYEIQVPWDIVTTSAPGTVPARFTLLVNDNDGSGRKGWLEWFSGLGAKKDLSEYGPLQFMPATK